MGLPAAQKPPPGAWSQVGMALSIPTLMVSGPLVGYGLGWLVRHWTGWGAWVEALLMALGMIAGVREVIKIIRKIS
jgi:F0F1-type ATP synthase assembly protein I